MAGTYAQWPATHSEWQRWPPPSAKEAANRKPPGKGWRVYRRAQLAAVRGTIEPDARAADRPLPGGRPTRRPSATPHPWADPAPPNAGPANRRRPPGDMVPGLPHRHDPYPRP